MKIFGIIALATTLSCAHASRPATPPSLEEVHRQEFPATASSVRIIEYKIDSACPVEGKATESAAHEVTLSLTQDCGRVSPTASVWETYKLIFEAFARDFPLENLKTITLLNHSAIGASDWGPDIAGAAAKSDLWKSYQKGEKASRSFVTLFNESHLGEEVRRLVKEGSAEVQLEKVEKISQERGKKMPFASQKSELFASRQLLPYTASTFTFSVNKPLIKSTN